MRTLIFSAKICRNHFFFIILQQRPVGSRVGRGFSWSGTSAPDRHIGFDVHADMPREGNTAMTSEKDVYVTFYLLHLKIWLIFKMFLEDSAIGASTWVIL